MKLTKTLFAVLAFAGALATANAQVAVYNSYTSAIVTEVYNNTDGVNFPLTPENFVTPISYYQGGPVTDYDNGVYFNLPIGFNFQFNGYTYSTVNVCVNGWINFSTVPYSTNNQLTFFNQNLPNALVAPFFGEHYLRPDTTQGFVQSNISWAPGVANNVPGVANGTKTFTIQWENLNVNYLTATFPKQSVATFQVILYANGYIEYAYGPISSGYVQTGGCAVGVKDQNGQSRMNGLFVTASDPLDSVRYSTLLTSIWPPSRQPGRVIRFQPFGSEINNWGDGDADLSQKPGVPQNLFVTTNDALQILESVATNVPLDSVYGRNAFHGDVNHNGRFILIQGVRSYDTTRTLDPQLGHPNDIVYFQATSYDAAMILLYLGAKLPELPWIYDTVPPFGKAPVNITAAVTFGNALAGSSKNIITLPILAQGTGAIGAEFTLNSGVNARLISVKPVSDDASGNSTLISVNNGKVAMALAGKYPMPTVVANATFEITGDIESAIVSTKGLTLNDGLAKDISAPLAMPAGTTDLNAYPNPFSIENGSQITFTTLNDGYVTLKVYDLMGNVVRSLVDGVQAHGLHAVTFDGRNDVNLPLPSGVYFYRLTADGISLIKQVSLLK